MKSEKGDVTVQAPVATPVRPQRNQNNFDDIRKVFQGSEYSLTDTNLQEVARVTNYDVSKAAIVRQAVDLSEDQNFEVISRTRKEILFLLIINKKSISNYYNLK